jgi:hypothetical protein
MAALLTTEQKRSLVGSIPLEGYPASDRFYFVTAALYAVFLALLDRFNLETQEVEKFKR